MTGGENLHRVNDCFAITTLVLNLAYRLEMRLDFLPLLVLKDRYAK